MKNSTLNIPLVSLTDTILPYLSLLTATVIHALTNKHYKQ